MVRHRLERLMRLTQGAALVAVAACTNNESKPGETMTNESKPMASAAPSAMPPTVNAVATPPAASASTAPMPSAETAPPAASASAATSAGSAPATKAAPRTTAPRSPDHINTQDIF